MEPASIRYKNPGAMWGSPLAIKWGAKKKPVVLKDGKGQGNNIAVFPTYVQGICAQLDLWRTSPNYKNKRFADAIAIWSGHNNVESYIKFVLARVPGMTRNTVMNDTFWKSPQGIAFLKAQAWHEAGKKYPAPDEDWIEAQHIVFSGAVPTSPVAPSAGEDQPAPPSWMTPDVPGDPEVYSVQKRLKALNYNPGVLDGRWGGGTSGALAGFINDRGGRIEAPASLDAFNRVRDDIKAELGRAESEGWKRPVSDARKAADTKTVEAVAPEVVPVKRNFWAAAWAAVVSFLTAIWDWISNAVGSAWDFFTDHKDEIPTDSGFLHTAWNYLSAVPVAVWALAIGGLFVFIAINSRSGVNKITEQVQSGVRQ
jgi:hypothetical protein